MITRESECNVWKSFKRLVLLSFGPVASVLGFKVGLNWEPVEVMIKCYTRLTGGRITCSKIWKKLTLSNEQGMLSLSITGSLLRTESLYIAL